MGCQNVKLFIHRPLGAFATLSTADSRLKKEVQATMLIKKLQDNINTYKQNDLIRQRMVINARKDNVVSVNNKTCIDFSSNDYLGIANHTKVKQAFIKATNEYGVGSCSSALVSGYSKYHFQLEEKFAEFLNRDKALLFNSGYHANLAVMTTLADRNSIIFSDKLCHASLLDGILLSRAKHVRYRHNDIQQLAELLANNKTNKLLVSESVFSMQGDCADILALVELAHQHNATLVIDDAHGIATLGNQGQGICGFYQLSQTDVPCLVTPLGKAFASFGAMVSGSHTLVDALMQFSRTYKYTTAMPAAVSCATLAALDVVIKETWRCQKLNELITFFIKQAKARHLALVSDSLTPIKSIPCVSNQAVLAIQHNLMQQGFLVAAIRPPTVANQTACIRISLNCKHTEKQIMQLLDVIASCHE